MTAFYTLAVTSPAEPLNSLNAIDGNAFVALNRISESKDI